MENIEKEIKLACKREDEYGCSIYRNVLECYKAVEPLIEKEGHSGMSYSFFTAIFYRTLRRYPLTPIVEGNAFKKSFESNGVTSYQCERYGSLFREEDKNGNVSYHDVSRVVVYNQKGCVFSSSHIEKRCEDLIPKITLPYFPRIEPIKIFIWEFDYGKNKKSGEYIRYIIFPDGEVKPVNKLYIDGKLKRCSKRMYKKIEKLVLSQGGKESE